MNVGFECPAKPLTVTDAIDRLLLFLSDDEKSAIRAMEEADLVALHFSLGLAIRNAWLTQTDRRLLSACGTAHADDASHALIVSLWRKLQVCR